MSAARSFFQNIDTELLSKQKDCLISLQTTAGFESETGQTLEGVLNLLDAISNVLEEDEADPVWYEETWYESDLINALEYNLVNVKSNTNIRKLRDECINRGLFNDKSDRNEMIDDIVIELFGEKE